jgi:hypothetical protein
LEEFHELRRRFVAALRCFASLDDGDSFSISDQQFRNNRPLKDAPAILIFLSTKVQLMVSATGAIAIATGLASPDALPDSDLELPFSLRSEPGLDHLSERSNQFQSGMCQAQHSACLVRAWHPVLPSPRFRGCRTSRRSVHR